MTIMYNETVIYIQLAVVNKRTVVINWHLAFTSRYLSSNIRFRCILLRCI